MPLARSVLATIPSLPGVYRFQDAAGAVLYIGKAGHLKKRVSSYFQKNPSPRIRLMLQAATAIDTIVTASEAEALLLENNLIKSLRPRYNILFRDDKSYPYLCLSKHAYPRLMFYRGTVKKDADYFGPFPDSGAVRETIDILQRVFRLRTCADHVLATRTRPCLLHAIGRCSAPCTNQITPAAYDADAKVARRFLRGGSSAVASTLQQRMTAAAAEENYEEAAVLRDRLRALAVVRSRHFAEDTGGGASADADYVGVYHDGVRACVNIAIVRNGYRVGERRLFPDHAADSDTDEVVSALLRQYYRHSPPGQIYLAASPPGHAEIDPALLRRVKVAARGEARERVLAATANARQALLMRQGRQASRQRRSELLAQRLSLVEIPRRLECFDISHSMGEETVAARVVFVDGMPFKREYRLYRIKTATAGDDIAAIGEAVKRCYHRAVRENSVLPDVLLIDGGAAQLAAALAAWSALSLPLPPAIAIAKGAARKPGEETLIRADGEIINLPPTDEALHLIQAVRDEAHRFAVAGHRRRRDKKRGGSALLRDVPGIGEEKRRLLISYFGGLAALRAASAKELCKVDGIGTQLAARIYHSLHR